MTNLTPPHTPNSPSSALASAAGDFDAETIAYDIRELLTIMQDRSTDAPEAHAQGMRERLRVECSPFGAKIYWLAADDGRYLASVSMYVYDGALRADTWNEADDSEVPLVELNLTAEVEGT